MNPVFAPEIGEFDLYLWTEGRLLRPFELLGAHLRQRRDEAGQLHDGVRFAVWAPHASRVAVVGDFNGWDAGSHPMHRHGFSGIWEVFVPGAKQGDCYKFALNAADGRALPWKADPFARQTELRPRTGSVVAEPLPPKKPLPPGRAEANRRDAPILVYEMHAGSWRRGEGDRFLTWDELAEQVPPYVSWLGFTHVELLPITEHPFDGSWGYQTLGQYAPTARHGDPAGFRRFVDACHAAGLGVLLDWVPAHFPRDEFGLAFFDGQPLYEYGDPRLGEHKDWNTLIYDWGRPQVVNFLIGSALFWCERMGVDGLRVDAVASMLYRDYSRHAGEWLPNVHGGRENFEAIGFLKKMNELLGEHVPGCITVAEESTAFPGVSAPTWAGGLGFHYKWNMGWMNDTLRYIAQDPVHRRWAHHQLTFGLVYAFTENFMLPISHDEVVHGKGSLLGRMPGDDWKRFANLRAYLGFMWGHPGKKLLFMGQEWGQRSEWSEARSLPWHEADHGAPHDGARRFVRDLNALAKALPALHAKDASSEGFEWLIGDDDSQSVLAWRRRDGAGGEVIVVCNFTPVPRHGYHVRLPADAAARWAEVLNSDAAVYGGSNVGMAGVAITAQRQGHAARTIELTLPPLATVWLAPALD